ncbi:hypothetical protein MK489_07715 [Myxococcota bacterium]|nr:hypothetical protein [Myxococcota bacterium]
MMASQSFSTTDGEQLSSILRDGVEEAVNAFQGLTGTVLCARSPQVVPARTPLTGAPWDRGISFEMEGAMDGSVGVLVSHTTCKDLTRMVERRVPDDDAQQEMLESMLLEVANIVASRIVSSVANGLGGRIVLSVPRRVGDRVSEELMTRLCGPDSDAMRARWCRVDMEFADETGVLRVLLVLAPHRALESGAQADEAFDTVG